MTDEPDVVSCGRELPTVCDVSLVHHQDDSRSCSEREALRMIRKDARFSGLVKRHGAAEFKHSDVFDSLIRSIVYQGISLKAANVVHRRLRCLLGLREDSTDLITPGILLSHSTNDLQGVGLGARKAICAMQCASLFVKESFSNTSFQRYRNEEISEILCKVKGIGQWTVDMLLMFALGRSDVLPTGDLALRRGADIFFGRKLSKKQFVHEFEVFRPYRSYACWYLWRIDPSFDPRKCILSTR